MNKDEFLKLLKKYNRKTLTHNEEQNFLSAVRSKKFKKLITKKIRITEVFGLVRLMAYIVTTARTYIRVENMKGKSHPMNKVIRDRK